MKKVESEVSNGEVATTIDDEPTKWSTEKPSPGSIYPEMVDSKVSIEVQPGHDETVYNKNLGEAFRDFHSWLLLS